MAQPQAWPPVSKNRKPRSVPTRRRGCLDRPPSRRPLRGSGGGAMIRPTSTNDLLPSERQIMVAMSDLRFGRFEFLRIEHGELILHPWPSTVRDVKFGAAPARPREQTTDFGLKK